MSTVTPAVSSATAAATTNSSMDKFASQSSASDAMKSLSSAASSASAALASESKIAAGNMTLPSWMKGLGIGLAVGSGVLIGASFVFKKKGLLAAQRKYQVQAGESYAYLKSPMWWTGMTMMILGEVLNLIAYAVTSAVLVTPLGALSVVISAILSSIFLKEKLTLFGKIGCFLCIVGSTVIALNGPEQHAAGEIKEFQKMFVSVGFLVWGGICIAASLALVFFVAPRYGKKYMLVYITICSLIGGLSVSTISGVGSAFILTIQGENQFKHWFLYFLLAFVTVTLLTEIVYLNKALELFNTAMVTPTYYVLFTFATLVTSIILFQGLDSTPVQIVTIVLGFLTICAGITLLQISKIDPEELADKGAVGLDRDTTLLIRASRSMVGPHEKGRASGVEDPGMDSIRGGLGVIGSIVRARSSRRIASSSADAYSRMADDQDPGRHPRHDMHSLNTLGKHDLERFELHDRPMPLSPTSPQTSSGTHLTVPRTMPQKRDTTISFASGTDEPHGHHNQFAHTSDGSSHRDAGSPTAAHGSTSNGGILMSPSASSQSKPRYNTESSSNFTQSLDGILESVDPSREQSKREYRTVDNAGPPAHRASIRVVGGPRVSSAAQLRDVRDLWDHARQAEEPELGMPSSAMPIGTSPLYPDEGETTDEKYGASDYMGARKQLSGGDTSSESESSRTSSPIAERRRGGVFNMSKMTRSRDQSRSRAKDPDGDNSLTATACGAATDDDEAEELLSPVMRDAATFGNGSGGARRALR